MPVETEAEKAVSLIREGGFTVNESWHAAHEIAQSNEGTMVFDAIHALLHRIEGDFGNAAYWDRRAGTDLGGKGPEDELDRIAALLEN